MKKIAKKIEKGYDVEVVGVKGTDMRKNGFTLAEILITVSVIGIVASMTIPPLIENINNNIWSARSKDTLAKFSEVTNQMKVADELSGYANTDAFVDELSKYIKITKRCSSNDLDKCFTQKFKIDNGKKDLETKTLIDSKKIFKETQDTGNPTVGIQTIDGMSMVISFDQKCTRLDPFANTPRGLDGMSATLSCLHMLYDTNGKSKPNVFNKDIIGHQIVFYKGLECVDTSGVCLTKTSLPRDDIDTCDGSPDLKWDERGSKNAFGCKQNEWAGAKKACDTVDGRLPTMAELAKVATYIYKTPIGAFENTEDDAGARDSDRAAEYGINPSAELAFWSSEASSTEATYAREFGTITSGSTFYNTYTNNARPQARCVPK